MRQVSADRSNIGLPDREKRANLEYLSASEIRNIVEMSTPDPSSVRRVLLVEDDDILRKNYALLLSAHRLSVCACPTKSDALIAFDREPFDVIILDVTLGGEYEAGFDLCQRFREKQKTVPIIFLTERDEDPDRISGLRLGADDYLSKTISGTYLVARINALIRRIETLTGRSAEPVVASPQKASMLRLDERLSRAFWHNTVLDLSLTQYWILKDLFEHVGEVRSTSDLMRAANITVQPNTIVVHIKAIGSMVLHLLVGVRGLTVPQAPHIPQVNARTQPRPVRRGFQFGFR